MNSGLFTKPKSTTGHGERESGVRTAASTQRFCRSSSGIWSSTKITTTVANDAAVRLFHRAFCDGWDDHYSTGHITAAFVFALAFYFSLFYAQKTHVKPPLQLTLYFTITSTWHVSYLQSAILDI